MTLCMRFPAAATWAEGFGVGTNENGRRGRSQGWARNGKKACQRETLMVAIMQCGSVVVHHCE